MKEWVTFMREPSNPLAQAPRNDTKMAERDRSQPVVLARTAEH
jgi:hypothetical protein